MVRRRRRAPTPTAAHGVTQLELDRAGAQQQSQQELASEQNGAPDLLWRDAGLLEIRDQIAELLLTTQSSKDHAALGDN